MSITTALSNALSGLTASSRAAGVVSTNLANILTDGYAPREIELTTQADATGGGVSVVGVSRKVDEGLLNERRLADTAVGYNTTLSSFMSRFESEVGLPDDPASLTARISAFEASLTSAASRPEVDSRLDEAVSRGAELAEKLNQISDRIQTERTAADGQIEVAVNRINTFLEQVYELNAQIANAENRGHPSASFQDQRQQVIDQLAEYVPLRVMQRDGGVVALYTMGGAALIDGTPGEFSFTASNLVAPHMTQANGLLSGLELNGQPINTAPDSGPIAGGRLASLFALRDEVGVDAQEQVDAAARNLIERFQDAGLDATRAPGDPGLFTDGGAVFAAANEIGIAGRIQINALVDSNQGGASWRLRDGLGALTTGPLGDASLLQALSAAIGNNNVMASGDLGASARSFSGHATSMVSRLGQQILTVEQNQSFAVSRQAGLKDIELLQGVDSDQQMQKLLLIEQSYNANARMIQTVDDMLETLLRI